MVLILRHTHFFFVIQWFQILLNNLKDEALSCIIPEHSDDYSDISQKDLPVM